MQQLLLLASARHQHAAGLLLAHLFVPCHGMYRVDVLLAVQCAAGSTMC